MKRLGKLTGRLTRGSRMIQTGFEFIWLINLGMFESWQWSELPWIASLIKHQQRRLPRPYSVSTVISPFIPLSVTHMNSQQDSTHTSRTQQIIHTLEHKKTKRSSWLTVYHAASKEVITTVSIFGCVYLQVGLRTLECVSFYVTCVSLCVCHWSSARLANDSALRGIALCGKHAYIYRCWHRDNTDAIATVAGIQYSMREVLGNPGASSKTPCEPEGSWSWHMATVVYTRPASPVCVQRVCVWERRASDSGSLCLPPLLSRCI